MSKSSSSQSTASTTSATDNRVAVGDSGVLIGEGATVDNSVTDNRDLSDNSSFSLDASDNSTTTETNIDSRDLSDNSSFTNTVSTVDSRNLSDNSVSIDSRDLSDNSTFSLTTTDARNTSDNSVRNTTTESTVIDSRDFSDRSSFSAVDARSSSVSTSSVDSSQTTINAADAEVLKATASGAFTAANLVTSQSANLLESALTFGDSLSARSVAAQVRAVDNLAETTRGAVTLASQAAGIVAANAKTADQNIAEKLIKAGAVVLAVVVGGFLFFRK